MREGAEFTELVLRLARNDAREKENPQTSNLTYTHDNKISRLNSAT